MVVVFDTFSLSFVLHFPYDLTWCGFLWDFPCLGFIQVSEFANYTLPSVLENSQLLFLSIISFWHSNKSYIRPPHSSFTFSICLSFCCLHCNFVGSILQFISSSLYSLLTHNITFVCILVSHSCICFVLFSNLPVNFDRFFFLHHAFNPLLYLLVHIIFFLYLVLDNSNIFLLFWADSVVCVLLLLMMMILISAYLLISLLNFSSESTLVQSLWQFFGYFSISLPTIFTLCCYFSPMDTDFPLTY